MNIASSCDVAVVGAGAMLGKKLPDAAQKEEGHEKSE